MNKQVYLFLKSKAITIADLIKIYPELMDIDYKETPISDVIYNLGYTIIPDIYTEDNSTTSWDFNYSDYKAYKNIPIVENNLAKAYNLYHTCLNS